MNGSVEVARILIENGADVNKMDKIRKSSLMVRFIYKHSCQPIQEWIWEYKPCGHEYRDAALFNER